MSFSSLRWIAGIALAGFLLAACGSRISLENYGKLKAGQSYDEVQTILGEPTRCDEMLGVRTCAWENGARAITVNFLAGQAALLSAQNLK